MSHVPGGEVAVGSGVLTHWREHDTVLESERADFERSEEFGC